MPDLRTLTRALGTALSLSLVLVASGVQAQLEGPGALSTPRDSSGEGTPSEERSDDSLDLAPERVLRTSGAERLLLDAPQIEPPSRSAAGPFLELIGGAAMVTGSAALGIWLGDTVEETCQETLIREMQGIADEIPDEVPISINEEDMADIVASCQFGGYVGLGVHSAIAPLAAALGVTAFGRMGGGHGSFGPAFAGGLLGSGLGGGAYYLVREMGGSEIAAFAAHSATTLLGSLAGYELSHRAWRRNWRPGFAVGPNGGSISLSGRF